MAVINAVETHVLIPKTYPYRRIGVHITTEEVHRVLGNSPLASVIFRHGEEFCHDLSLGEEAAAVAELLWGMVREYTAPAPLGERILAHRFEELLIRLYRVCPHAFAEYGRDEQMEQVCRLIDREFSREITVEELAKMHFFSTRYFIRRFHRAVGYTPHRYLLLRRLAEARVLLSTTDLSVTLVAAHSGFGDAGGFVRAFRKEMGTTPGEYRKRYAREMRLSR
jgi:AraC-like DNA-binding protein